jgi:ribonuclease HIII
VEKTYKRLSKLDKNKIKIIQKSKGESEIPVAVASILAKSFFEEEVSRMCRRYGIDFRKINPAEIPKDIIEKYTKLILKTFQSYWKKNKSMFTSPFLVSIYVNISFH